MTCAECGGRGWYARTDTCGELEQVQCEICYGSGVVASPRHPCFDAARKQCDDHLTACNIEGIAAQCAIAEAIPELVERLTRLCDLLEGPTGEAYVRTCALEER